MTIRLHNHNDRRADVQLRFLAEEHHFSTVGNVDRQRDLQSSLRALVGLHRTPRSQEIGRRAVHRGIR